jgi:hypothetical protein
VQSIWFCWRPLSSSHPLDLYPERIFLRLVQYWCPKRKRHSLTGSLPSPQPHRGSNRSFARTFNGRPTIAASLRTTSGVSKGLEIVPAKNLEVILAVPPYIVNNPDSKNNGFGDWQFLVKYRIAAGNEEHRNYILTAFYQMTLPTGQYQQGALSPVITPTIAYGKGFGNFDVQGTLGYSLPTGNVAVIGHTLPWNNNVSVPRLQEILAGTGSQLQPLLRRERQYCSDQPSRQNIAISHAGSRARQISHKGSSRFHRRWRIPNRRDIIPSHQPHSDSIDTLPVLTTGQDWNWSFKWF